MAGAFFANVAANLVAKLGEYLFAPIGRQFGYVLLHNSYVEDLENGVRELEIARERVQESVNEAMYDGKPLHTDVKNWLDSAKEEAKEAEKLLKRGESAKYACFRGWLPNPLVRHAIGEKVKKMTQVIQELYEKSQNSNFQKVYYENTPTGIVTATTSVTTSVDNKEDEMESRAKITEDVMKAIVDDKFCVIGVWGVGGVGKSRLLEDIERQVKKKKLFDVVVIANVSRNLDIKRIQGEIAYALGLRLTNDEPARGRAYRLCKMLESDPNKSILIILDNLWEKLELKEVGIPCGYDNKVKGCKLLLTSRYRDVLRDDMGCDQEFHLNELEHGEAQRLFERVVGDKVNDPEFKPLIDGVVQNCGGLPLLILSVAKRLKHGDLIEWRNSLTNIKESDIKSIMELNYNDLKDERIKSLFLICALASGSIYKLDSMVYCIGLGLFKKFMLTIEKVKDRLIEDIRSLQDSSLLLNTNDENKIRMHDIFVDKVISIASTEWNALVGRKDYGFKEWSKDELRNCTAMSFHFVGIHELPKNLECPNLRILLLFEDNPSLKIPKSFFKSMENLQVLDMTGLSFSSLPSSIEFLENLKSLNLDNCHMEDVTALGKLKGLQCLSLCNSSIARLPKEIGALTDLRILALQGCTDLKVIEPGVLGSLVKVEFLSSGDGFDQWEDEDQAPRSNASLAELKNMKDLSMMSISIPHSTNLSGDLPFGKLKIYAIQIGDVWDWLDDHNEERSLKLKLDSGNLLDEEWVQRCLRMTQDLYLDGLQDGNDSINDLCVQGFQELKHLHIQNSISLQYIIHSSKYVQCNAFPRLESLFLKNLNSLEKICHGCLGPESFDKLKIVKVDNCGEIKYLFSLSMMRIFLKVEEIEISRCHLMQQIVTIAEADEDGDELPISKEIWNSQLPSNVSNLKFLKVEDCTFLLSIIPSYLLIKLQNLEAITVERCQLIRELFDLEGLTAGGDVEILSRLTKLTLSDLPSLECICSKNPQRLLCFRNLKALKVQNCENLRFLFSSCMAKVLKQIKKIEITSCKLMEEIMDVQEEKSREAATINTLEFPLLTSLSLQNLPNLYTFSHGKYCIHCPSLIRLRISGCPKMTTFSSFEGKQQSMTTYPSLQQVFGRINSDLSSPVLFNQYVHFPSLEELTLLSLCGLRRIWHNELPVESFCKLASITVRDCENLSHIFPSTLIARFQSLKMIEVVQCISLEVLMEHVAVNYQKRQKGLVLSALKEVKLWHLPRLNAILTSSTKATFSFPSLTNVSLHDCHNLRYLFTNDTARTLHELEMLDISDCNNMQEVVAMEEGEERELKAVKFSHLHTLKLCSLNSLISFSSGSCAYEFLSLRNLSILECIELKAFILRMNEETTSFDEGPYSLFDKKVVFSKLEELHLTGIQSRELWKNGVDYEHICHLKVIEVKHCHNLLNVIPSFMWKRLLHYLESLTVESCNLIEGIYTLEGLSVMERVAERSSPLRELSLCDLPKLTHIWKNEDLLNLCLRNLTSVRVGKCPHLRSLFTMSMAKSLGQLRYLGLGGCGEMEYIVVREEEKPEEAADIIVFPQLVTLYLQNMPKLKIFCQGKHISEWPSLNEFTVGYCKAGEVIVGDTGCRKLESNVQTQQALLLVNKLITLQSLEAITIEKCQLIREVFDLEGLTSSGEVEILSRLRELTLSDLPSLERIWNKNPRRALCFRNLRALKVQNCENLRFLFSPSMAKALGQIKEIEIASCKLMEEIIDAQEEELEEASTSDTLEFPLLISLSLEGLPNLKTFSYQKYCIHCPSLTKLTISRCPKMMTFSSLEAKQWSITSDRGLQQAFDRINSGLSLPGFFNEKVLFPSLEELKLFSMCQLKNIWHNQLHRQSFCKLASLTIEFCENLSHIFPSNSMDRLQSLNKIEVVGCPSLETLFDLVSLNSDEMQKPLVLSSLEKMKLLNLPRLRDILKSDCKLILAFPSLWEVSVRCCHSLSYLFSSATARTLDKLVVLDVSYCNNMKGIIAMEEGTVKTVETFKFRNLSTLKLGDLENLICFNSKSCARDGLHPLFDDKLAFPKLEELHVKGVQQKELWNDKIHVESFCRLKVLKVKQCHNLTNVIPSSMWKRLLHCMESLTVEKCQHLRNLFTMAMAKSLGQLQYLGLSGCGEMEYIVTKEEEKLEEAADKIVIPQLVTLYLHNMPKLRSFFQGKHISEWPSLKEFTIEDCKAVEVILGNASRRKLEGSIPIWQPLLHVKKVEFPAMESMKILHMDNMEKIWLDDLDSNAFGKLKTLVVEHCEKLLSIFSSYNMLTRFQNLEKITVTDCGSLEVAFQVQEFEFSEACSTNSFHLGEIVLTRLPKMKDVWNGLPRGGLTFGRLQRMKVVECESLKSLFPSSVAKNMTHFKELLVMDCGVEEIIAEKDEVGMSASDLFFPQLTDLKLLELPKLGSFYQNNHTLAWPLLKQLRVRHCSKMRSFLFACEFQGYQGTTTSKNQSALFSFEKVIPHLEGLTLAREDVAMIPQHYVFHNLRELTLACYHDENVAFPSNFFLHRFPNLEELYVICSSFEEIFPEDSSGHGGATPCGELTDMEKPLQALRNLRRFDLYNLRNLKRIWKDGSLMVEILERIEELWVMECPSLSILLPSPTSFQRLMQLEVHDCASLVHMGTCSAVTSLVHLTWLTLKNCGAMEDVVTDDGNGTEDISFLKLVELILDSLPSLESFSPTNRAFRFPSLVRIVVTKCPKMNIFCKGALRSPNLNKVLLSEEDDEGHWEGDLNTTIQTLSA